MGPIANPSTYRVIARVLTALEVMSKSAEIPLIPGAHIVGAIFLRQGEHSDTATYQLEGQDLRGEC